MKASYTFEEDGLLAAAYRAFMFPHMAHSTREQQQFTSFLQQPRAIASSYNTHCRLAQTKHSSDQRLFIFRTACLTRYRCPPFCVFGSNGIRTKYRHAQYYNKTAQDLNLNACAASLWTPFGFSAAVGAPAAVCRPHSGRVGRAGAVGLREVRDERCAAVVQRGGEQSIPGLYGGRGLLARVCVVCGRGVGGVWVGGCMCVCVCVCVCVCG